MSENSMLFTEDAAYINVGAHVCAIHEDSGRVLQTLSESFKVGLDNGESCAYIASEEAADEVRRLLEASGVEAAAAESEGSLLFITDRTALLVDGEVFDPAHAIEAVKALFGQKMEAGYAGLRLSADVPWMTRGVPGGERAMEFETMADEIVNVPGVPLLALCQYRLSDLDPEDSIEILERHPMTLVGGRIHINEDYAARP